MIQSQTITQTLIITRRLVYLSVHPPYYYLSLERPIGLQNFCPMNLCPIGLDALEQELGHHAGQKQIVVVSLRRRRREQRLICKECWALFVFSFCEKLTMRAAVAKCLVYAIPKSQRTWCVRLLPVGTTHRPYYRTIRWLIAVCCYRPMHCSSDWLTSMTRRLGPLSYK